MQLIIGAPILSPASNRAAEIKVLARNIEREERVIPLPHTFVVSANSDSDGSDALSTDSSIEFQILQDSAIVGKRVYRVDQIMPVLIEKELCWTEQLSLDPQADKSLMKMVHIRIPVRAEKLPRSYVNGIITQKQQLANIADLVASHKKTAAIGLAPACIACAAGIIISSPIWIPAALVTFILGSPIWVAASIGSILLVIFTAISGAIGTRMVRSKQIQDRLSEVGQSQLCQYLLFQQGVQTSDLIEPARQQLLQSPALKLVASLIIDAVGSASFVVPVLGEVTDIVWAPISSSLVSMLYSDSSPNAKYLAFVEEILPFTDFIPTATLAWAKEVIETKKAPHVQGK